MTAAAGSNRIAEAEQVSEAAFVRLILLEN